MDDNKNKFQEMLADILEVARVQGNRLSREEIKSLFGDMNLNDSQYEHIFAYLAANHIKIDGYVKLTSEYDKVESQEEPDEEEQVVQENELDKESNYEEYTETDIKSQQANHSKIQEEDSIFLKMYLEDLDAVDFSTTEEGSELIEKIVNGDNHAKNRFIETNLRYVVQIAEEYKNKGIILEDLIQEGNIGLLSAIEALSELSDQSNWKPFITEYIKQSIEAAIGEQKDSSSFEGKVIDKIKFINDAANELAEDLGREADINELAECTRLTVDEIRNILNLSADAVKINKHNHAEESHSCCNHNHEHHNHNHDHCNHDHCNHNHNHDHHNH